MTRHVSTTELKAKLSEILGDVERGEAIVVTRHGARIARILPSRNDETERRNNAVDALKAWRKTLPQSDVTVEDLLTARNEGRR